MAREEAHFVRRAVLHEFRVRQSAVEQQAVRMADIANPTKEQLMTITMKDVGIKLKDPNASVED